MIALISTRASRCIESLRANLLVLQHEHIKWLSVYFEWEELSRQGEDLHLEMAYARRQIEALRGQMTRVNTSLGLWSRLE